MRGLAAVDGRITPVMNDAEPETRKQIAWAAYAGCAARFMG